MTAVIVADRQRLRRRGAHRREGWAVLVACIIARMEFLSGSP